MVEPEIRLYTIGHSNGSLEDFLSLLREFEVGAVADVRRFPSSRKFPHFNRESLGRRLAEEGIRYAWLEGLGGRRHGGSGEDSPNCGLRSPGFRNYADHMMSEPFRRAVEELLRLAQAVPTAVTCAERLYWKCHRRLLSDHLTARGAEVNHIIEPGRLRRHRLTPGAVITEEGNVIYPPEPSKEEAGG